jgi:hypothetical protein
MKFLVIAVYGVNTTNKTSCNRVPISRNLQAGVTGKEKTLSPLTSFNPMPREEYFKRAICKL